MIARYLLPCCLLLALAAPLQAQPTSPSWEASELAREARASIAEGDFDHAIQKFAQATKLAPDVVDYRLGLAQAWFFEGDYTRAMELCQPLMTGREARAEAFQIFGNCLDGKGQSYEALAAYRQGLAKFPKAGVLYLEMGMLESGRGHAEAALAHWESGIRVQPFLAPNYFFAAQQLFDQADYGWAAVYAETFINLVRDGEPVRAMSKLLMQCHERARSWDYDSAYVWHFHRAAAGTPDALHRLWDAAFASELMDSTDTMQVAPLAELRRFACLFLPTSARQNPAAPLTRWHRELLDGGQLEAYHYWLLSDARPQECTAWLDAHKSEFEAFEAWMQNHTLQRNLRRPMQRPSSSNSEKNDHL